MKIGNMLLGVTALGAAYVGGMVTGCDKALKNVINKYGNLIPDKQLSVKLIDNVTVTVDNIDNSKINY